MSLVGSPADWKRCTGCLNHHPVFVLGNGPTLPEDLSPLDGLLTIGVNRIWWSGYDPTIVMWTDNEIERDVSERQADHPDAILYHESKAVVFIRDEINYDKKRANDLEPFGNSANPCHDQLNDASRIAATGNMGTAAAFWAMGLGCRPVYLLGMSGGYVSDETGEAQTNFYGVSPYHNGPNEKRMRRALDELLAWDHVFPVPDQEALNTLAEQWQSMAMGREWYADRFRACFHSG